MIRKKFILCLLLLTLFANFAFAQNESDAKTTVEKFYKFYRTRSGLVSTHELNLLKGWFTSELTRLFRHEIKREDDFVKRNHNEKPYFGDGFPFKPFEECIVAEKIIINRLEIGKVILINNKSLVEVKFFIPNECENLVENKLLETFQVELLKSGKKWLINDWIYSDGKRLTDILKREKY